VSAAHVESHLYDEVCELWDEIQRQTAPSATGEAPTMTSAARNLQRLTHQMLFKQPFRPHA
jgi:hypothetical protein